MRWLSPLVAMLSLAACGSSGSPSEPPDCEEMECYRPYVCVERCGGPVISSGCCSCRAGQLDQLVQCPESTETDEPEAAEPATEEAATVVDSPCSSDDECLTTVDCGCSCIAQLTSVEPLQGEAWSTMCNGGPPPNCSAQSPCASFVAACDTEAHRCVTRARE